MKVSRTIYKLFTWVFVVGVLVQVFFAGMAAVANAWPWTNHIMLGHILLLPLLIMLVTMYIGRLPRQMKLVTWLTALAYVLTADVLIFMRTSIPVASAFHPVMALIVFALGAWLIWQGPKLMNEPAVTTTASA